MNYLQAVAYIESLSPTLLNPSLERIAAFMDECGRLQDKFQSIHIGGTNGKGSTVALVDSVLRAAGLSVGRFTGPHLLRWNERFHVNGQPISDDDFARLATHVRKQSENFGERHSDFGPLTWFEYLTAIAFFYFVEKQVDIAVIEVGLGGRWDATNVLSSPLCSAITSIDFDHTHILGNSLEEIAREKAGIIKPGVPLVTATSDVALEEIQKVCVNKNSPCIVVTAPGSVKEAPASHRHSGARASSPHSEENVSYEGLEKIHQALPALALAGPHQELNAMVAGLVLDVVSRRMGKPLLDFCLEGFANCYWPGRFQYIKEKNCVLDGAHNVAGARALRDTLETLFPDRKRCFVLGFFQNKDVEGFLSQVIQEGDMVFAGEPATRRAVFSAANTCAIAQKYGANSSRCETMAESFEKATATCSDRVIIATGSFATVRELMQFWGCESVEDLQSFTFSHWPDLLVR